MATVDRMTALSNNRQQSSQHMRPATISSATSQFPAHQPVELSIVHGLEQPASGYIASWQPLRLVVSIRADQIDYLRRVLECQSVRNEQRGVVWAAEHMVIVCDDLIGKITCEIIDDLERRAARLDRNAMLIAIAGLLLVPILPLLGMSVVLLSMLTGLSGWLLSMHRTQMLGRLLAYLDNTREQRISQVCIQQTAQRIMRGVAR